MSVLDILGHIISYLVVCRVFSKKKRKINKEGKKKKIVTGAKERTSPHILDFTIRRCGGDLLKGADVMYLLFSCSHFLPQKGFARSKKKK